VVRGGSYSDGANKIRSASRQRLLTQTGDTETGFRVLREV
jgi:formylglycine-generating enzyme required for sulfatase activity